jgi:hypothetical protein
MTISVGELQVVSFDPKYYAGKRCEEVPVDFALHLFCEYTM